MERITISLEPELAEAFDALITERGYRSRSEAVRDLLRHEIETARLRKPSHEQCVAALSYLFNHHQRDLGDRLTELHHDHHDLTVSTLHAHLDHDHCIECAILRGPTDSVRRFADALITQSGVHHGSLNLIGVERSADTHTHSHPHAEPHIHYRPRR